MSFPHDPLRRTEFHHKLKTLYLKERFPDRLVAVGRICLTCKRLVVDGYEQADPRTFRTENQVQSTDGELATWQRAAKQ